VLRSPSTLAMKHFPHSPNDTLTSSAVLEGGPPSALTAMIHTAIPTDSSFLSQMFATTGVCVTTLASLLAVDVVLKKGLQIQWRRLRPQLRMVKHRLQEIRRLL
jgi:hypothetical protein